MTETEGMYKPLGLSVASNCLKIVEIRCANVDSKVHKLLKILTTYGIRLEQIRVQQTSKISASGCKLNGWPSSCSLCLFRLLICLFMLYKSGSEENQTN